MAEEQKIKKPITDEIATAQKDIDIFSGWLNRLENPDPTLRTEAGGKGLKLYDEVDRDPHAGSVLQTRYLSVIGKEYEVLPGDDTPGAADVADFVKNTLQAFNFTQACQEILQAILYGFYVAEVIWQVKDGKVFPYKIRAKHPRRFSFTVDRDLRLLTPTNMIEGEPVPERKFIVFSFGSSDNPYGKGLGQKLWWPVWFKKNGIKFWLVFLEKFGIPTTVGKYPPGTDKTLQAKLLDAIDAIHSETGVAIPENMAIDLLEATRTGNVSHESLCEYMDKQISKAVLGQTATTEGTPGKLGNENAQEEVRSDILEADADLLCECLNETLIRWIVDFNFSGVAAYPKLWIRTEEEGDLKPLADRDEVLVNKIGLPVSKKYFYETYAIPEPEKDDELVKPQSAERIGQSAGKMIPEFAEKIARDLFSQEEVDRLSQQAAIDAQKEFPALLSPVMGLIEKAKSFEELGAGLYEMYPDMDSTKFQELLTRAMFASSLVGYGASKEDENA